MKTKRWLLKLYAFGSPAYFYRWSQVFLPWLLAGALILLSVGLWGGLIHAPADALQGEGFRIMYVHVPCAVLSLALYVALAIASFMGLIWRLKVAFLMAHAFAIVGCVLTFLALVSGSIWAKPMWGVWWIWDARLTSELILFFLYTGYLALYTALNKHASRDTICAILALVGALDVPVIHYSVEWWNTLHQGASISKFAKPSIDLQMAWPLVCMIVGTACYSGVIILLKVRTQLLGMHQQSRWIKNVFR